MHELSIAVSLVEEALKVLEREGGSRVISLTLRLGELSGVEKEPLTFCFPLAAQGSALEKARLIIEPVPIRLRCGSCGKETESAGGTFVCPHCSSHNVSLLSGRELSIKELEIE